MISGNSRGGFGHVDRDADEFGAGLREFEALLRGRGDVGRVRVGHGLDDDGRAAADLDLADLYADRVVAFAKHCEAIVANRWSWALVR